MRLSVVDPDGEHKAKVLTTNKAVKANLHYQLWMSRAVRKQF
jgi:hypothetical protein